MEAHKPNFYIWLNILKSSLIRCVVPAYDQSLRTKKISKHIFFIQTILKHLWESF